MPHFARMRTSGRFLLVFATLAAGLVSVVANAPAARALVPAGFTDELVVTVGAPTAFAFTPDGRLLVTTQGGTVRIVENGALLATPAVNLGAVICANSERGLLGIAVDPQFPTNGYVFLYYSRNKSGACDGTAVNRVSRFVLTGNTLSSETVLIDNIPSPAGNHNAGDLQFGKDGLLYVSVGDGGCDYAGDSGCAGANDAARDRNVLLGKILRIDRNGGIPSGNPFTGAGTARCNVTGVITTGLTCQETFAWGLRNPFRMAFDPNATGTVFHINDVGQNAWEEIDLGTAGADYGWNVREGHCPNGATTNCQPPPGGMTDPIFDYGRSDTCASITGGAFVPKGVWPAAYQGRYLFADYVCGRIFRLDANGAGGYTRVDFATGLGNGSAVHLGFGPWNTSQALYYTTYAGGGQVRRIVHTPANQPPTAAISATPSSGPAPLTVSFAGTGSSDPEGGVLTYEWTFGDGTAPSTGGSTISHTYAAGTYTASLTVIDDQGVRSAPATTAVTAGTNSPPSLGPLEGPSTFKVGDTISFRASATDDQPLGDGAYAWTVLRNHADHTHPWDSGTGPTISFPAPTPEDLPAATNSSLTVSVTITDASGATDTETVQVQPRKVTLSLATSPTGRSLLVNGTAFTAPASFTSWEGWTVTLEAPSPQGGWRFRSWSDGGARVHTVTTPASAATYTATFTKGKK